MELAAVNDVPDRLSFRSCPAGMYCVGTRGREFKSGVGGGGGGGPVLLLTMVDIWLDR